MTFFRSKHNRTNLEATALVVVLFKRYCLNQQSVFRPFAISQLSHVRRDFLIRYRIWPDKNITLQNDWHFCLMSWKLLEKSWPEFIINWSSPSYLISKRTWIVKFMALCAKMHFESMNKAKIISTFLKVFQYIKLVRILKF